jgi:hypothetical protein
METEFLQESLTRQDSSSTADVHNSFTRGFARRGFPASPQGAKSEGGLDPKFSLKTFVNVAEPIREEDKGNATASNAVFDFADQEDSSQSGRQSQTSDVSTTEGPSGLLIKPHNQCASMNGDGLNGNESNGPGAVYGGGIPQSQAFHDQAAQFWVAKKIEQTERRLLPKNLDVDTLLKSLRAGNIWESDDPCVQKVIRNVSERGCIHLSYCQFSSMVPSTPVSPSSLGVLTCPITRSSSLLRFTYYLSLSNPGKDDAEESFEELDRGCMCICM